MTRSRLDPRLRDRLVAALPDAGWRRALWARRLVAGLLASTALVLAVLPPDGPAQAPVLVAAVDVGAGSSLRAADLAVRSWPRELVPAGALTDPTAALGRVLAGAARAGEPITDVRLAGAEARAGPGSAAVPVRLADAGVAGLLGPGSRVDVVGTDETSGAPVVLAADAAVLAVLPAETGPAGAGGGRMILVSMSREQATYVASASVAAGVAITLR